MDVKHKHDISNSNYLIERGGREHKHEHSDNARKANSTAVKPPSIQMKRYAEIPPSSYMLISLLRILLQGQNTWEKKPKQLEGPRCSQSER